jgi:hypothetical protein
MLPIFAANSDNQKINVTYSDITLFVNGNVIIPKDVNGNRVEPFAVKGTTYLPVRAVGNALNKDVKWVDEENTVYLTDKTETTVTVSDLSAGPGKISSETINVAFSGVQININGTVIIPKDADGDAVKPFTYNGTLYLPIRALANAFGEPVQWDGTTNSVYIGTYSKSLFVSPTGSDVTGSGSLNKPWQTIAKARDFIRQINGNMASDIVVYLRGGTYTQMNTITFDSNDSGTNGFNIRYENAPGETPVISGGKQITGWILYDAARNIYKATLTSSDRFRQLYINGERAVLARTPNLTDPATSGPYYKGGTWNHLNRYETHPYPAGPYTFSIDAANVPAWNKTSPLELVTVDHWRMKIAHIASLDVSGAKAVVNLKEPEANNGIFGHANQYLPPLYTPYYFQNTYEALDAQGEWYLDTKTNELFYKPRPGEDMSTAQVIIPSVETLIDMSYWNSDKPVNNITIKGITLEYTNWIAPDSYGYADWQTGIGTFRDNNYLIVAPGAIQIWYADNIVIDNCTIRHTGAHAVVAPNLFDNFSSYVSNCVFQNNTITDTSSGGIFLCLQDKSSTGNIIQNNLIENGGREYYDSAAILVTNTPDVKILHNEVCYYGGTGITFGWQWDDNETTAKNIEVAYNKIHDVMRLVDDSAGIYSLGNIPNSSIHDNYIYNIIPSEYQGMNLEIFGNAISGIYLDGGANKTVFSNVIDKTGFAFNATNTPTHGNVIRDNFYNCKIGKIGPETLSSSNLFVDGAWPAAAQAIIDNAGIEK